MTENKNPDKTTKKLPEEDRAENARPVPSQAEGEEETIVVTGLRRSLQSAQNIKRNSDQIVDAIVAEDIGKLPDVTASAALARVTGVQVTRAAAEAAEVQIRGLPDISTTYNGREIFTAENRFVAIQDFPAGGVAALEVFKSGTANLIEGGLGGQVNVRSRRPFDFSGLEVSGSVNLVHFESSGDWDWNGNLLLSNRWDVGDGGEFGALINVAMTNVDFLDSTREQDEFVNYFVPVAGTPGAYREAAGAERGDPNVLRAPNFGAVFLGRGERRRPSVNAALQYKPNADLQFYVDGLFQGYRGNDFNLYYRAPLYGGATLTDVEVREGTNQIERARATGGRAVDFLGFNEFFKTRTNTYQVGGGVIYDFNPFRVTADLAYTDSTFTNRQFNFDILSFEKPDIELNFADPSFNLVDFDTTDPQNFQFGGLFFNKRKATGTDWQGRVDLEWETGFQSVPRIQVGFRHNDRDSRQQNVEVFRGSGGLSFADLPINPIKRECGFKLADKQSERCFVGFRWGDVFDNIGAIRAIVGVPAEDPDFDPTREFTSAEKATAAYAQLRYEFDVGFPIDGLVGLRAVRTKTRISGIQRDPELGQDVDASFSNSYTDYLPNISARLQLQPNLQMRFAYTQTRTRPSFVDLSPSFGVGSLPVICATVPTDPSCRRFVRTGNPTLDPVNSNNLDATLEYYFSRAGSASVALFRRKIRGFIFRDERDVTDPEFGLLRINSPQNGGDGKIQGVEVQGTTFFDFDFLPQWARGFGVQANYTYLDASTELSPAFRTQLPGQRGFPGVSKHAYNLVGLYEQGPVTARLAYNYRSKFIREYLDIDGFISPRVEAGHGVLDFSASFTPIENITLAFDALNLLAGKPIKTYRAYNEDGDTFPFQRRYLERVFSFGIRARI
jgi:TonB-dependent receptor